MNGKKGVSDIVVTILLVLLSLAAVAIVWAFIRGSITGTQDTIVQSQACMKLDLQPVACDITSDPTNAVVRYKLGSSESNLTGVRVLIEKSDGSVSPQQADIPKILETKSFKTSVVKNNAKSFSVAGVIVIDGKEVNCAESEKVICR